VVLQSVNMTLTLGTYFVCMWWIHPGLTLACLSTTIGIAAVTRHFSGRLRPAYLQNRELNDRLVLLFTECVKGMQTVKGFAAESQQTQRFAEANRNVQQQQQRIFLDLSIFTPATQLLSHASLVILFAYGGFLYVQGRIPLGAGLVVFAGLLQQFNSQVANVTTIANSVQQSIIAARRVFEVLDARNEVENSPNARSPGRLAGRIRFEGVSFGYSKQEPVLSAITFEAAPGQILGVFGATGVGKSSLLSLIPRFYDPLAGRILADGIDVRELDLNEYRRQIGIVYQESFLFSNTVAANIAFGNPQASQDQIEAAARTACAHEFIVKLPHGYETVLGESGVDLSGGQRQRIALARALLTQPPVLILDDPTASVDPRTEREILEALRQAVTGRTAFVAANRLSLLRRADTILVLEDGRLVAQGTHEELVRRPGPYQDAARIQLVDLALENTPEEALT
jgi:ATP-binding cassette subfamily B protein